MTSYGLRRDMSIIFVFALSAIFIAPILVQLVYLAIADIKKGVTGMASFSEITLYSSDGSVIQRWDTDSPVTVSQGRASFHVYDKRQDDYIEISVFGTVVIEQQRKPRKGAEYGRKYDSTGAAATGDAAN